jgi:hypothetical protein
MKFSAIVSLFCIAVAPVMASEDVTSYATTTITKTLVRVNAVTATPSSSANLVSVSASSTPMVASTSASSTQAAASATKTGGAVALGAGMPAALVAGSFALIMGAAL